MKIDLSTIDPESFMVHQHFVGEHECWLIQPTHIGCQWSKDNMHLRSVVVNTDGEVISASFPKFFNLGEHPELTPIPPSLKGTSLMQKIDGSTLIMSRYKGHNIIRTRGTVDVRKQDNGYEIDYILEKYPKLAEWLSEVETSEFSLIFEWTTPTNVIVLNYGEEPDITLIGCIYHENYALLSQNDLDEIGEKFGVKRPARYAFDSVEDMQAQVSEFKGIEGLCMYYNAGQNILKVKGNWYLYLHRMKSEVSSIEKVIEVWFQQGRPSYTDFYNFLCNTFDFEIAEMAGGHVSRICEGWKEVEQILVGFNRFVVKVQGLSRKDAALAILQAYGETNRAKYVFSLLDNKPLTNEHLTKLLYQVLKN